MSFEEIDILDLLPQRPPFVLIDRLVDFDERRTVTQFTVRENHLLCEAGRLQAAGLIENIAQTCAARMGYINLLHAERVKLGFIGAIRDLEIRRLPRIGETLRTTIMNLEEVFRMLLVEAEVHSGDELLATARMKIALSEIDAQNR
ncbi:pseudouridylate synthase [Alistipes sp.]|uniref:pseudouridylate synthase n=1 Tax=Alistipes sp. TaxID=1872444 RepID=UPI003A85E9EC